ncbi:MAG: c-type cytochrome [Gammaproteobacteria bacterium]|nr:c-type cytochrome [Gammaproteobacteria bacterium]MCP5135365.1 c-type cytochrome [Gammaproteobacteria bacterium]
MNRNPSTQATTHPAWRAALPYLLGGTLIAGALIAAGNARADGDAAKGEKMYAQNCQVCHQADAIGLPGFAPSLTNPEFLEMASDKFILSTVRDGRPGTGMPPFSHLGRSGVQDIVAFLRSHSDRPSRASQIDAQPEAHGDPRLGELWFAQICSTCHGVRGDGYAEGGTGTAIGTVGFLSKASDGFIRETIKVGRSNTRMLGFKGASGLANLTDREIDDIIVYLRSLKH